MDKRPKLDELAARIYAHLKRLEADRDWNAPNPKYKDARLYYPNAWRAGSRVGVRYVSYQCITHLTREQAERYLAWLDAGNKGKHYEASGNEAPHA